MRLNEFGLKRIQRAAYPTAADFEHMGIDHGRFYVGMTEELLHRAYIVAGLQYLRRKRMPQGVRCSRLMHLRQPHRTLEGPLKGCFVCVMAALDAGARIGRKRFLWKRLKHSDPPSKI